MGWDLADSAKLVIGVVAADVVAVVEGDVDEGILQGIAGGPLHHKVEVVAGRYLCWQDDFENVSLLGLQRN
jgi:hypothetical protein